MKPYKLISIIFIMSSLSGCFHFRSPKENLAEFYAGNLAVVISSCEMKGEFKAFFFMDATSRNTRCDVKWRQVGGNGESVTFSYRKPTLKFIEPGTYRFSYIGGSTQEIRYSYTREENSPSMLTDFTVKGGEVIYIGSMLFDTFNSKIVLQSIKPFHYKLDYIKKTAFGEEYSILKPKLQNRLVRLKDSAKLIRDNLPVIEKINS